jgi:hypothetical protein
MDDTILSNRSNRSAFEMAQQSGGEFRVMVRSEPGGMDNSRYSGAIAAAQKLKRPRKYPNGFAFAVRIKPIQPLNLQGTKSDV